MNDDDTNDNDTNIINKVVSTFIKELEQPKEKTINKKKCIYCNKYVTKINKMKQCKKCMLNYFYNIYLRDKMII